MSANPLLSGNESSLELTSSRSHCAVCSVQGKPFPTQKLRRLKKNFGQLNIFLKQQIPFKIAIHYTITAHTEPMQMGGGGEER